MGSVAGGLNTTTNNELHISNFLVRKSSLRQIANFGNYPGDYRHKSGDQKKRLKKSGDYRS